MTNQDFQNKLAEIQKEQQTLKTSPDSRKKAVRARIQELNILFFETKKEWRQTCGWVA